MVPLTDTNAFLHWLRINQYKRDEGLVWQVSRGGLASLSYWETKRLLVRLKQYETKTRENEAVA